jgi:hypothetical protein
LTYRESPPTRECDYRFGEHLRTRNGSASSLCATTVSKSLDRTSKNAQPNALSLSRTRYNRCTLDRRLGNINAELEQLTMDVGRTPKRVLIMPNADNSPEATAIDVAYEAQVQALFKSLITNLGDEPVSHQTDQQCVDKFTAGLNIAKRAKQLVLNVFRPALPVRTAASRSKKIKKK